MLDSDAQPSLLGEVAAMVARLAGYDGASIQDPERIDLLRALEELKCAAEAAQAEVTADFAASQCAQQEAAGMRAGRRGRGVAGQVALARRESPHRGQQHLGLARVLRTELPCTRAAFRAGKITEWRATMIARETACLSLDDRIAVDRAIAGDVEALESYSERILGAELRKLAARLDPSSVVARRRRAETERCVTIRPAPDTMAYLTVLLPVASAVAAYAALKGAADTAIATGDSRGRGQLMADTLVTRVTQSACYDQGRPVVPVSLGLVMSDAALFAGAHDTAHLAGYGPIPADLARELTLRHLDTESRLWLRRLYAHPVTGELVAMDSRQRLFRGSLRHAIELRDQFCRNPWCNAPIRHLDHVTGIAAGGRTRVIDGQGLCEACNHAKQAPGWRARPSPEDHPGHPPGHRVETTTPTGHTYTSGAPPLLRPRIGAYQEVWPGHWTLIA